jgi:quercetin dioxygenase-like cupin family protein
VAGIQYASYVEALAVPDGGIASRPLLDVAGGLKVVLFALDADQEISPHQSPFPAEVLVLRGRMDVTVGERRHALAAGGRAALPMGAPHGLRAREASHFVLLMLRDQRPGEPSEADGLCSCE